MTAYTVEQATELMASVEKAHEHIVFHLITKDIKEKEPDIVTAELLKLCENNKENFSNLKIYISLGTPRFDKVERDRGVQAVNALLCAKVGSDIGLIDHTLSFTQRGQIKHHLYREDCVHLHEGSGVKLLAANIRYAMEPRKPHLPPSPTCTAT